MVLTAGLGTRLRPLSLVRAKPALPVAGVPLAGRILQWLSASGVPSAVLNLHHLPATITAAIGDGQAFGLPVRYSWEPIVLGSAGGPLRALPLLAASQFFIVNGDTLTDLDLAALAADHLASGARVTMALIANPHPRHYGGVTVDQAGCVTGFTRRGPDNRGWHFIGVQAVNADVFAGMAPDQPAETVSGIYRALMRQEPGSLRAFISHATFRDIGTPADYLDTCLAIAAIEGRDDALAEPGTLRGPGARITRSVLWDDVHVGGGAVLDACVVGSGVRIPDGARFDRRVILTDAGRTPEGSEQVVGGLLISPIDAAPAASRQKD